jgi:hypothetical protein
VTARCFEWWASALLLGLFLAPAAPGVPAALELFLRATVPRDVPAVCALLVDRDKVLFEAAAGWRDEAAASPARPGCHRARAAERPVVNLVIW